MTDKLEYKNVEELLAEADELIRRIQSEVIQDMEEEHRRQFEEHTENFSKIKAGVQEHVDKHGSWDVGSGAEGMHEAMEAIVKATQDFKKYLF
jgi:F0F1-type ATP synthase membrane subunit b/b'